MAGTLYANPLFASGMAGLIDDFMGGNPREAAAAELYAAQAANENDTRAYRQGIVSAGPDDLAGMLTQALAAGNDFSGNAPEIASSLASLPGSGYSPGQADRIAVGTGTQDARGTFGGLGDVLENALAQTGMNTASRERIATADRDAEAALARGGQEAFASALRGISPTAQTALERLQSTTGPLNITSGYRDPGHNAAVGGAKGSEHIHGNAFDVSTRGMDQAAREALIRQARAAGFKGIGVYDNSLHFDVGGDRAWGPDYHRTSLPDWAADDVGAPVGAGEEPPDSIIDPEALNLLLSAGTPGMTTGQSGILKALASDLYEGDNFGNTATETNADEPPTLSAGGRTALINALGEETDPAVAMTIASQIEQLMAQSQMSENEALAYALQPDNQDRPMTTDESILPFGWGDEEVPGPVAGIKMPGGAVGDDAAAALQEARDAIAKGASPEAVAAELRKMGYDPAGL